MNTSVCKDKQVAIPIVYYDYKILSTPTVTKVTDAGNLESVHWGNRFRKIDRRTLWIFNIDFHSFWSTGDVPESCGSKGHTNIFLNG